MTALFDLVARTGSHAGWMGGPGHWWIIVPLLWLLLAGTVVWLLARRRYDRTGSTGQGAVSILAARYARGEIDTEEFRRRLDEMRGLS